MIALLRAHGADVVFQQHQKRRTDFRRGQQVGALDHVVVWHKPASKPNWLGQKDFDALPEIMPLREARSSKILGQHPAGAWAHRAKEPSNEDPNRCHSSLNHAALLAKKHHGLAIRGV